MAEEKEEKKETGVKKEKKGNNYALMVFLVIVGLVVGLAIGYYLFSPKVADTGTKPAPSGNVAAEGKIVLVDYIGRFENGTVFDTSLEEEAKLSGVYLEGRPYEPFSFTVGKGQVIEGFEEAIIGMKAGDEIEVTVPPEKAYNTEGHPLYGKTLIFKLWVRGVKEPITVQLTIVNDPDCGTECDTTRIVGITENVFPGVQVTEVDSNSEEGKALIEKYEIIFLPAYILSGNIIEAENYERNSMVFEKRDDRYVIKADISGATYYANEEARKKAEEEAKKTAEEKCQGIDKVEKPEFDAFVVSYCPFGLQMQRILVPVSEALGEVAEVKARYMGAVVDNKVTAMHGDKEAQENLRQICLREEQEDKFWNYLTCFIKEGKTDDCLDEVEVDTEKLETCMSDTSKGIVYAQEDFDLQSEYQVTGSPTLILNGERVSEFDFGGRTAEAVKTLICCSFSEKPEVCDEALTTGQAATGFSPSYSSTSASSGGTC